MPFKMNLRPMMRSMAPMARNNMPQGGLNMAAPRTGYRMPQNPMMASPGGGGGFDERTGVYTPEATLTSRMGGMLSKFAEQFRNADNMTNTRPGMLGGMQPRTLTPEEAMAIASMPATGARMAEPTGYMPAPLPKMQTMSPTINEVIRPTHRDPVPVAAQPLPDVYVRPAPRMETPMPEPTMPTMPAFDPNRALNDYNNRLAGIYAGGGNMDMNMVRAQQANLRNLQLDRNATAEQHDAAYRAALSELRSRYPDAFAG